MAAAPAASGQQAVPPLAFDPEHLQGADERRGALAAVALLQATTGDEPSREAARAQHVKLVLEQLDPSRHPLAAPAQTTGAAARRIVEAMGLLTAAGGPPFPRCGDALLSLLGRGDRSFRGAVLEAIEALVDWERRALAIGDSTGTPTIDALGTRLVHNPPPEPAVIEDVSRVLWRVDGKRFLEYGFEAVRRHCEAYPRSTDLIVKQIRARLRITFSSVEKWLSWWDEQKDASLSEIFAECQRIVSEEAATQWRQAIGRLRETQDAERILAAVEDALQTARAEELRLEAVAALAEFTGWIREAKISAAGDPEAKEPQGGAEALRAQLLERAFHLLLDVTRGTLLTSERPEVSLAAMAALRKQRALLGNRPDLLEPLSKFAAARLEILVDAESDRSSSQIVRSEVLELVRTTGSLRLVAARQHVETILSRARQKGDLELLAACTAALGELTRSQLSRDTANLFISLFEERDGSDNAKAARMELRRACVSGLNAMPADAEVRTVVRSFYLKILESSEERELRLGAILGLGTLAQGKDQGALEALVTVVSQPQRYEPLEVIGALDAIAYVGGQEALSRFVSLLSLRDRLAARDKAVFDHLWRKVIGLVLAQGHAVLPAVLQQMQSLAVERDSVLLMESVTRLCTDPQISGFLSTEGLDAGDAARMRSLWTAALALARAAECAGAAPGPEEALLAQLSKLQAENPQIRTKLTAETEALGKYVESRRRRKELAARLDAPQQEPEKLIAAFEQMLAGGRAAEETWLDLRWFEKQLALRRGTERGLLLARRWRERMSAPGGEALFGALGPTFRERYQARIDALVAPAAPPAVAPAAPSAVPPAAPPAVPPAAPPAVAPAAPPQTPPSAAPAALPSGVETPPAA